MKKTDKGGATVLIVRARSRLDLNETAKHTRGLARKLGCMTGHRLDAMMFLEHLASRLDSFRLHVAGPDEFPSKSHEGLTTPEGDILIREDVYCEASEGGGRARFTVVHELMHWMLHRKEFAFARASQDVPPFRDPEWQANTGSSLTLMPRKAIEHVGGHPSDLAELCGVSLSAAEVRCNVFRQHSL